jgi:hypothetical protein
VIKEVIKEVPVEKIVERVVEKEVIKEIIKEVIKEVQVEKIVDRVVEKEVIKEVFKEKEPNTAFLDATKDVNADQIQAMPRVLDLDAPADEKDLVSQVEYQQLVVAWGTVVMAQLTA